MLVCYWKLELFLIIKIVRSGLSYLVLPSCFLLLCLQKEAVQSKIGEQNTN